MTSLRERMKSFSFSGVRVRLVLLVLLAVGPALGLIFYAAEEQRSAAVGEAQQNALRLARLVSANQDRLVEGAQQLLTALAQIPEVRSGRPDSCSAFLRDLLAAYPLYVNFGVARPDGKVFCSALPIKGPVNAGDRIWFQRAMRTGDFAAGDYQIGRITGKAAVNFGYPILGPGEKAQAVVFAALELTWFNKLALKTRLPLGATVTVIDRNRTILARYPESGPWIGRTLPEGPLVKSMAAQNGEGIADAPGLDGSARLFGFAALGSGATGAAVIVGLPKSSALAPADRILARGLVWLAVISLLAVAGAWWAGKWLIVGQMTTLMKATEKLAAGDLAARVPSSSGKGEMDQLAHAFNRMAQGLERQALEAERAHEELERLLRRSTALREINTAVTSTLDLQAVLSVLMKKIDVLLPDTALLVWLMNQQTGHWERTAGWNLDEAEWKRRELTDTPHIVKAAIESKRPISVLDVPADPRTRDREFYRRQGLVSCLGVPLLVQGEALGVLAFLTRRQHEFAAEEIEFLATLAGQAAVAIHNSQLHQQTKRQTVELEKANKNLAQKEAVQELLKELSQDIASLDIDGLLKKLTEKVREFFRVDVADVRILDHGIPRILGVSGIDEERLRLGSAGNGRGGLQWVTENRRPLIIRDIAEAKELPIGQTIRQLGIRAYLGVPLFSRRGEVVGILRALSYPPRDFHREEIDLLQQVANGAAIALENHRLLEQIKSQAAQLEQAHRVKNEFLGFVSHELRTPVNVIMGYTTIIQNQMAGKISAQQEKNLEKMNANSRELLRMIDLLLEATKIEAGAVKAEIREIKPGDFLEQLKSDYAVPLSKDIRLVWDFPADLPAVATDGDKLRHVMQNLIGNAIKYTPKGKVTVSARYLDAAGQIEFSVADTGIGIAEEDLPRIFQMFTQVKGDRPRSGGGVGLGLHIVKAFTEVLGGSIDVTSERGRGSTFTLTLPDGRERGPSHGHANFKTNGASDHREQSGGDQARPVTQDWRQTLED